MGDATQATQSLPEVEDGEEELPKEKVWGRLISLNPSYANVELTGTSFFLFLFCLILWRHFVAYNTYLSLSRDPYTHTEQ